MVLHESNAFPSLRELTDIAERRWIMTQTRRQGWLKPWRWLFSRKDEEDEDEDDTGLRSPVANLLFQSLQHQLPQLQHMMQPMASTQQVQHAIHPSMQQMHQKIPYSMQQSLQADPSAMSALDALGPGTFMNYGDDLIYVPFQSLKQFNGLSPEWMNLWGNMGNAQWWQHK